MFELHNKTTQQKLADKVIICNTFFSRLKGLLGKKELNEGEALILTKTNNVHSFFMQFAIDLIFLNKQKVVIQTIINFLPNKVSPKIKESYYVVELSANFLLKTQINCGDYLYWEE